MVPFVQPVQITLPPEQTQPLELDEDELDDDELDDDELDEEDEEELDVDGQTTKAGSHTDVPDTQQVGEPLVQIASVPVKEQVWLNPPGQQPAQVKPESQLGPVPPRSQQRGLPPSIEQVGDLVGSEHMTEEHPVQSTFPLEQIQPLELEEEDEDEELDVDEQIAKEESHVDVPGIQQSGDPLVQTGSVPGREQV